MKPFQVFLIVLAYGCIVKSTCTKIESCNECLVSRCVWYEFRTTAFCGNRSIAKSQYTAKIRRTEFCPSKTQTTHPVLTDSSAPPAGTLTVIASNILARVSRDLSPQSAASGVRQTIFKQESINSTNSHNSTHHNSGEVDVRNPAAEFESAAINSTTVRTTQHSGTAQNERQKLEDHIIPHTVPLSETSAELVALDDSTLRSSQENGTWLSKQDYATEADQVETYVPPGRSSTYPAKSDNGYEDSTPSSRNESSQVTSATRIKREILKHQCREFVSFSKLRRERKGRSMTREEYHKMVRKCLRTML